MVRLVVGIYELVAGTWEDHGDSMNGKWARGRLRGAVSYLNLPVVALVVVLVSWMIGSLQPLPYSLCG